MLIRILETLAFIACCLLYVFISMRIQSSILKATQNKSLKWLFTTVLAIILMVLLFFKYWLFTGIIPIQSILLLFTATAAAQVVYAIAGSAIGLTIEAKQNKIQVISLVRGFELGLRYPWMQLVNAILGILMIIGWITAIVIFWRNAVMTNDALFWIAFIIFIAPQLLGSIIVNEFAVPALLSTDYDNDLRNQYFFSGFINVISTTILIMFPIGLLYGAQPDASLPPYWLIILTPLLLFILLTLFPFWIGTNKYYHQQLHKMNWRIDWLSQVNSALTIPDEAHRKEALAEKLDELYQEIRDHDLKEHEVLQYVIESDTPAALEAGRQNKNLASIIDIFSKNKENIFKWDTRANYFDKLLKLHENIQIDTCDNCKTFVATALADAEKEREKFSKTKNQIAGFIVTAVTAILGFVVKHFEADIIKVLGNLV